MFPCQLDPDAWFGYEENHGGVRTPEDIEAVNTAKNLCITGCPSEQRRKCARTALEVSATYGIWAGVELRGRSKPNFRADLRQARRKLHAIAEGKLVEEDLRVARRADADRVRTW